MASQVSDAFNTKTRVNPDAVWNASFLPSKAELERAAPQEVMPRDDRHSLVR
jgi:NitT/TauT family transport system substrate-binding protein